MNSYTSISQYNRAKFRSSEFCLKVSSQKVDAICRSLGLKPSHLFSHLGIIGYDCRNLALAATVSHGSYVSIYAVLKIAVGNVRSSGVKTSWIYTLLGRIPKTQCEVAGTRNRPTLSIETSALYRGHGMMRFDLDLTCAIMAQGGVS